MRLCRLVLALAAAALTAPSSPARGATGTDKDVEAAIARLGTVPSFHRRAAYSAKEVELGRKLFFDASLSATGKMSCATCHVPARHYQDGRATALGRDGKPVERNTLSLLDATFYSSLFWDGRAATLEDASLIAAQNPKEMASALPSLIAKVSRDKEDAAGFAEAFPGVGVSSTTIGRAFAAYVASLAAPEDSPFDRFLKDRTGLSPSAVRGFVVFSHKAGCINCHASTHFNYSERYHNIGLAPAAREDVGRYAVDPRPRMWGAFRIPSLRNVALTAPYMHDGRFKTLAEVVDFYDRGGDKTRYQDAAVRELHLTPREKADLLAFMMSLTSSGGSTVAERR